MHFLSHTNTHTHTPTHIITYTHPHTHTHTHPNTNTTHTHINTSSHPHTNPHTHTHWCLNIKPLHTDNMRCATVVININLMNYNDPAARNVRWFLLLILSWYLYITADFTLTDFVNLVEKIIIYDYDDDDDDDDIETCRNAIRRKKVLT